MKCRELRTLLHDFVDGELDRAEEESIGIHLEKCAACAELATSLENLKRLVRSKVQRPPVPAGFEERLRSRLAVESQVTGARTSVLRSPAVRAAAALLLLSVAILIYTFAPDSAPPVAHADMVGCSLELHSRVVAGISPGPQYECENFDQAREVITRELGHPAKLPFPDEARIAIHGLNLVDYRGRRAVRLCCSVEDHPFSVFAVACIPKELRMKSRCCFCPEARDGRYLVVCRAEGDIYYSMVSEMDRKEFLARVMLEE